jgi:hypothetical protein
MHRLVQKTPAGRATKSYEVLHFDITIFKKGSGFDGTSCIAHFTDEFTSFNWVFPLIDHQEKTLMSVFKGLINRCDRAGLSIIFRIMVRKIRSGQETSIGTRLEDWVSDQGIEWDWSAKNTSEQNGKLERFGVLLTEKARCIREFFKLLEDLYPECYLAAAHLLNRTLMTQLSWDSPLVRLQRLSKEPIIRWELDHLKVFGCKVYVLLKGADASPRSEKMKARAFVGYLVGYDSINIFRVWNLEKGDVSDYRDVIFDENAYYDTYNKQDLIKESERKNLVQFRTYSIKSAVNVDLLNSDEEWLETSVRDRLVLENRTTEERPIEIIEEVENSVQVDDNQSVQVNDDLRQLPTSFESPSPQHLSPQIISLRSGLTGDGRVSRFQSFDAGGAAESSNVTVRRKGKGKKPQLSESGQLPATGQTSLNVTEFQTGLGNPSRDIGSVDLDEANILPSDEKRSRKPTSRYAQVAWGDEEMRKFPRFHAAFMAGILPKPSSIQNADQSDQLNSDQLSSNRPHISNLPPPPAHWRAMLRHPHAEGFRKAAQVEYEAIENRGT